MKGIAAVEYMGSRADELDSAMPGTPLILVKVQSTSTVTPVTVGASTVTAQPSDRSSSVSRHLVSRASVT